MRRLGITSANWASVPERDGREPLTALWPSGKRITSAPIACSPNFDVSASWPRSRPLRACRQRSAGRGAGRQRARTVAVGRLSGRQVRPAAATWRGDGLLRPGTGDGPDLQLLQQDAMFAFLADGSFQEGVDIAAKLRDDVRRLQGGADHAGRRCLAKGDYPAALDGIRHSRSERSRRAASRPSGVLGRSRRGQASMRR